MIRVFIDASVLFSACYSKRGYSRDLINLALQNKIILVVNEFVLEEVRRNLVKKAPETLKFYEVLLANLSFEVAKPPTKKSIEAAAKYIDSKDALIVASAKKAQVDYLVTFDRKHFINNRTAAEKSRVKLILPEQFFKEQFL